MRHRILENVSESGSSAWSIPVAHSAKVRSLKGPIVLHVIRPAPPADVDTIPLAHDRTTQSLILASLIHYPPRQQDAVPQRRRRC
jgi:hypothetical protein